jgi:hypothetical protein
MVAWHPGNDVQAGAKPGNDPTGEVFLRLGVDQIGQGRPEVKGI